MTRSNLRDFWKNLVLLSFENLTIIIRTASGRRKTYRFDNSYEMISFYEKCAGVPFGKNRIEDPESLLQWRSS